MMWRAELTLFDVETAAIKDPSAVIATSLGIAYSSFDKRKKSGNSSTWRVSESTIARV